MPHNLVVTAQGKMSAVGRAADAMALDLDAQERHYVPSVPEVLHATRPLFPGEHQQLAFMAPETPGDYPYVCTYPGHWITMNGTMHVVEEVDEAMLAEQSQAIESEGGHGREVVKNWTMDDLAEGLIENVENASAGKGREIFFETAGCGQCHLIDGEGIPWRPHLTKTLDKYPGPEQLLRQILHPSENIEDAYQAYTIETMDFETLTGFLVEETEDQVKLRANPEDPGAITTVARDNIDTMTKSQLSIMPTGLMITLYEEEIHDLLAYLMSL